MTIKELKEDAVMGLCTCGKEVIERITFYHLGAKRGNCLNCNKKYILYLDEDVLVEV